MNKTASYFALAEVLALIVIAAANYVKDQTPPFLFLGFLSPLASFLSLNNRSVIFTGTIVVLVTQLCESVTVWTSALTALYGSGGASRGVAQLRQRTRTGMARRRTRFSSPQFGHVVVTAVKNWAKMYACFPRPIVTG